MRGKLARVVLRGLGGGNAAALPGADGKGPVTRYLAGGLLHSGRGGWKRTERYLAGRLLHYGKAGFTLLRKRVLYRAREHAVS